MKRKLRLRRRAVLWWPADSTGPVPSSEARSPRHSSVPRPRPCQWPRPGSGLPQCEALFVGGSLPNLPLEHAANRLPGRLAVGVRCHCALLRLRVVPTSADDAPRPDPAADHHRAVPPLQPNTRFFGPRLHWLMHVPGTARPGGGSTRCSGWRLSGARRVTAVHAPAPGDAARRRNRHSSEPDHDLDVRGPVARRCRLFEGSTRCRSTGCDAYAPRSDPM